MPGEDRGLLAVAEFPVADPSRFDEDAEREVGRMIEAVTALRRYRDEVGAKPSARVRGHLAAEGYEAWRDHMARLARFEWVDGAARTATSSRPCRSRAAACRCCPRTRSTPSEAQARIEKKRAGLVAGDRARREEARERAVRGEGAGGGRGRGAPQARGVPGGARGWRHELRQAEEYLLSLELFGMRFGLDRMHRLMTVLGLPQRRFASIHVVGSNGKSSTVRFCAAILERHGLRTGSYTSPHLRSFRERIEVGRSRCRRRLRGGGHARGAGRRAREPDGGAGRPRDPVRGAHGRGLPRAGAARGGGGGDRGGPRRPLRRDQRDPVEGPGAHLGEPRAHALARADADRHRRARSWPWCTTTGRWWWARSTRGLRDRPGDGRRSPRALVAASSDRPAAAGGRPLPARELRAGRGRGGGLPRPAARRPGGEGGGGDRRAGPARGGRRAAAHALRRRAQPVRSARARGLACPSVRSSAARVSRSSASWRTRTPPGCSRRCCRTSTGWSSRGPRTRARCRRPRS